VSRPIWCASQAKVAKENAWAVTLKAEMTGTVENSSRTANNSANAIHPPSPPIESKNSNAKPPPAAETTAAPPSPPANTGDAGKSPAPHGGACDHGPVIGTLMPTGECQVCPWFESLRSHLSLRILPLKSHAF